MGWRWKIQLMEEIPRPTTWHVWKEPCKILGCLYHVNWLVGFFSINRYHWSFARWRWCFPLGNWNFYGCFFRPREIPPWNRRNWGMEGHPRISQFRQQFLTHSIFGKFGKSSTQKYRTGRGYVIVGRRYIQIWVGFIEKYEASTLWYRCGIVLVDG